MGDFKFEFGRHQISKITRKQIIEELEKVAKHFNYTDFKQDDFNKIADISYFTVYREFGSWEKTMQFLKEHLKEKGIDFKITSRRSSYTVQEMFDEMERIWVKLGHRPSRNEWVASSANISYDTIYRYFGGWKNACLKFIEYKMGKKVVIENKFPDENNLPEKKATIKIRKEDTRTISLKLRLDVLKRDNFRCVFCGRSPATDAGVILHIDHIIPFAKGGKTILENLQTLCSECNIGKSDS